MQNQGISGYQSEYKMVDVGTKLPTHRTCLASGRFKAQASTLLAIRNGNLPKGNVLPLAEAAGIIAVKKTSETLPLCHPLPIDAATIHFEFHDSWIEVTCKVSAHAKTGVEMEALSGVSAALLCLYDLAKGIDPVLEISDLRLIQKEGGKSGLWIHPKSEKISSNPPPSTMPWVGIDASVIVLSDRCARGESEDRSGPALVNRIRELGGSSPSPWVIPDDAPILKHSILKILETTPTKLLVCTGGSGAGPRDITPETVSSLGAKLIPGFGERIRSEGARSTPFSYLSRSEAFVYRNTLILCLPGSVRGATESLDAVVHLIPHTLHTISGANHG